VSRPLAHFEIRPNDSSGMRQFALVGALLALPGAASAALFVASDAWIGCVPAVGTTLASVWALAVDTRLRRGRVEYVEVRDDSVAVHDSERERPGEWFEIPRAWLCVELSTGAHGDTSLALVSGGRRRSIGRHLDSSERQTLAQALRRALASPAKEQAFQRGEYA
jgi:uncharacterized membrane protein